MNNRLIDEVISFLKDNADLLAAISNSRGHGSIVLDIRDGVITEGSLTLAARRKQGERMELLPVSRKVC